MKYCPNCGAQLSDDARFCGNCGTSLEPVQPVGNPPQQPAAQPAPNYAQPAPGYSQPANPAPAGPAPDYASQADGTVRLCQDGKYRWVYELRMFKNPTLLITLFKVFGAVIAGIWLFVLIVSGFSDFGEITKVFFFVLLGFIVLILLSYSILALMYGGKYCVLFEMDDAGINHIQLPRQFKKAQVAGWIGMLAGVLAGNPTAIGAGVLAASRNSLYSSFGKVKSIKASPDRNVIKVNGTLKKNQVYVDDEGFNFVLDFIRSHCPKAQ
ncbi:MAG: zinc ribbon domain-containing protein [Bacteroidales bacterium]|nr:zinc ribbon domain-containing protein [Bacteroidales bacterium]